MVHWPDGEAAARHLACVGVDVGQLEAAQSWWLHLVTETYNLHQLHLLHTQVTFFFSGWWWCCEWGGGEGGGTTDGGRIGQLLTLKYKFPTFTGVTLLNRMTGLCIVCHELGWMFFPWCCLSTFHNIREWTGLEFTKSRRQWRTEKKMEETGCEIICGAPTTPAVKG